MNLSVNGLGKPLSNRGNKVMTPLLAKSNRLPPLNSKRRKILNINQKELQKSIDQSITKSKDKGIELIQSIEEVAKLRLASKHGVNCGNVMIR